MTVAAAGDGTDRFARLRAGLLRAVSVALVAVSWVSAAIFGAYIFAYYGGAVSDAALGQWNKTLPRLYEPHTLGATIAMGGHFFAGAVILFLGPIQLIGPLRRFAPAVHRWTGRIYVVTALMAGVGGLVFIALKGTVGGLPMTIGFGLYGVLMVLCAVQTYLCGRARNLEAHRAWAIRLFALAIGSWLYRMDYGFWSLIANDLGHAKTFDGPFDVVMAFFFYVPNLIVAEAFIRARRAPDSPAIQLAATVILAGATAFLVLGTYYFTLYAWGPAILSRLPL